MKKFLGILLAGFIGFLSIFTSPVNLKNSAEPQYFKNNTVQNAIVETNTNTYEFYLSTPESFEYSYISIFENKQLNNYEYYYFNENKEKINIDIQEYTDHPTTLNFYFENDENNVFYIGSQNNRKAIFLYKLDLNYWVLNYDNNTKVLGFGFNIGEPIANINEINEQLTPYIGNLTSLEEPQTAITQIGSIISDTTNWFVNIFIGLSEVFYSDGQLGVWGSVLFLGVAFTLVSMVLKWVISLIRGI